MRITNSIITNNTIRNVNINKSTLDSLYTQLSTGKLIQKASENPIIAIRALRFRSEMSELQQYLKKNIPDARSWMTLTEDALTSVDGMVKDMITYTVQATNGPLDTETKLSIINTMKQYRGQIHEDANATYSGRSIFTGYKTNSTMTFTHTDPTIKYDITETFTPEDLDTVMTISNSVDAATITNIPDAGMPKRHDTYRLRLSYDKVEPGEPEISYTDAQGAPHTIQVKALVSEDGKYYNATYNTTTEKYEKTGTPINPYEIMANDNTNPNPDAYLIADTGEVVMNKAAYQELSQATSISMEYTKIGFEKGELRPENYFGCTCTTNDGIEKKIEYSPNRQDINYTVNFNQTMKVNTEGRDVFKHDIIRDMDELIDITQKTLDLEQKVKKLENMQKDSSYSEAQQKDIETMLAAAKKELDYSQDILVSMYGAANTSLTAYQNTVVSEISDIGARCTRLSLNETRLGNQNNSLEELKSVNEDADEAETIIHLTTAHNVYEASLSAASKLLSTSLLDYI